MISKEDLRARSLEWQLRPNVVEKDYVLGWLLAAIAAHPEASRQWVFKGGTCLKKCFFETYRFSEDLDFSLLPGAQYTADQLQKILREITDQVTEMCGIAFPPELIRIYERKNRQDNSTFEGRLAYRGPMGDPSLPRVRFDLTRHEPILDRIDQRSVYHAYPDGLPTGTAVATYSIDELFAEKLRALAERTRPRDLYDVVFILENRPEALDLNRARGLFAEKCGVKSFPTPTSVSLDGLIRSSGELASEWANMLAHQLPELPPLDSFLTRIGGMFAWLDHVAARPTAALPGVQGAAGEELVAAAGLQYWGSGVGLEAVRFAGANRLLVEFSYHGRLRRVEPYSLRRAQTGNLLLYAWELASGQVKAFNVTKMSGLRATSTPFTPRYRVEFTASAPMVAPSIHVGPRRGSIGPRLSNAPRLSVGPRIRRSSVGGPVYVFRCTVCGKQFRHSRMDGALREHKNRSGHPCYGRYGTYVRTDYR